MEQTLKGKHAVVTGGSRGIGKTIAHGLLEHGARVLLLSRNSEELDKAKADLFDDSYAIETFAGDVSDPETAHELGEFIDSRWNGKLDILVNAAGIYGPIGALASLTDAEMLLWEKAISINLLGSVYMCRLAAQKMKKSGGGVIVNFSGGGEGAHPNFSAYVASKGAVVRFTETFAAEVSSAGISVNAIAPGAVNTEFLRQVLAAGPEKAGKKFYEESLEQQKSGGTPPELTADFVALLCSEAGQKLTGNFFSVKWDSQKVLTDHAGEINDSDIYKVRRIKPEHRGKDWK